MLRGILDAYADDTRRVFVADSFAGLPPPDTKSFPADAGDRHRTYPQLEVSRADVEDNFRLLAMPTNAEPVTPQNLPWSVAPELVDEFRRRAHQLGVPRKQRKNIGNQALRLWLEADR